VKKERTRSVKYRQKRHCQERPEQIATHLVRGRGSGPQHTRMASECGPVRPRGPGLNQDQGQGQSQGQSQTPTK